MRAYSIPALLLLAALLLSTSLAPAQPAKSAGPPRPAPKEKAKEKSLIERLRSPYDPDRPVADKLRSPRETFKTLYYAVITYDLFPVMMEDALACLDLDGLQPKPAPTDAVLLALDLERLLRALELPLSSVPNDGVGELMVIHDAEGFRVALRRGADGGWRFDAETLRRVAAMNRALKDRPAAAATTLREGFTSPRATIRQFQSDTAHGDFYAAARALDLSSLSSEERRERGPALAQMLACVMQRRGYVFRQEVPDQPLGPQYTWHADSIGRVALERVRQPDGKDAWLFTRQTVRAVPRMYEAVKDQPPDMRHVRLGLVIPLMQATPAADTRKRPSDVPSHLGSPRVVLQGFFRTMDDADSDDTRLTEALEFLDLEAIPLADRGALGGKLATKLEAVLRKLQIDLSAIPDNWNAGTQALGEAQGVRVEIVRQRDGCWRFSEATVARVPEMFDKLAGKARSEPGQGLHQDSARDTLVSFQAAASRNDFDLAAHCLHLGEIHASAREELGPVLAFKLKYVLDRIGRIYVQEISDNPEGPRCLLYRGEVGRIVLDRKSDEPDKGRWFFSQETVQRIETMFRTVHERPPEEGPEEPAAALTQAGFWRTPGVWVRLRLPAWVQVRVGMLDLYQWAGLALAALVSWLGSRVTMAGVWRAVAWLLHRFGSALSANFVQATLRPLTWLATVWLLFVLLAGLDLPIRVAGAVFAAEKFLLAGLVGWLGLRLIDLTMGVYTNSELLRPHRSLSDMIVPVSMRLGKTVVVLVVATYIIYQVGEIDLLGRFLTGLGVAGLAASLAAQDAMKSFFGTLLLIGERAFKIGDRINVGGKEGVVELVGFRSTRLRTAEDSLLTVPNSVIASAPIDNLGARMARRFETTVVLPHCTPLDQLLEYRDRLRDWLDGQEALVHDRGEVHVHRITDAGIELHVSATVAAGAEEAKFREAIHLEILRLTEGKAIGCKPAVSKPLAA